MTIEIEIDIGIGIGIEIDAIRQKFGRDSDFNFEQMEGCSSTAA